MASHPSLAGRDNVDVILPPVDSERLDVLVRFVEAHSQVGFLQGPDGERVDLPAEVYQVLRQVVESMQQGKAAVVAPQRLLLTTQEAADFLGISRPTLVKLLEDGSIPFEKPNRHRRVRLEDVVAFQSKRKADRLESLNRLSEEADELGLGDEEAEDYVAALRSARRQVAKPGSGA